MDIFERGSLISFDAAVNTNEVTMQKKGSTIYGEVWKSDRYKENT